jgi:hypothetical protein
MRIGVFNLQKGSVEGCQMLHLATVRPSAPRNQSQKSSTSGAKRKLHRRRTGHIVSKMIPTPRAGQRESGRTTFGQSVKPTAGPTAPTDTATTRRIM